MMTLTVGAAVVLLIIGECVIATARFGARNAATLFFSIWALVAAAFAISSRGSGIPLAAKPIELLVLGGLAFGAGAAIAPRGKSTRLRTQIDEARFATAYRIAVAALAVYVVLQVAQLLPSLQASGGVGAIFGGSGQQFRRAYLADRAANVSDGFGSGGVIIAALGYALSLGTVSLAWAGRYIARREYRRAAPPILLEAIYSLLSLQRASFIYSIGICAFATAYFGFADRERRNSRSDPNRGRLWFRIGASALILTIVVVPYIARGKGSSGQDTQATPLAYISASLAGLNGLAYVDPSLRAAGVGGATSFADETSTTANAAIPGHGRWTFQGVTSIAARLGLVHSAPPPTLTYVYTSADKVSVSNTYSYVLTFFYDWGVWGVVVMSFVFGFVTSFMDSRARSHVRAIPVAAILMTSTLFSFFGLSLIRDFRYDFLLLLSPLLSKFFTRTKEPKSFNLIRPELTLRDSR